MKAHWFNILLSIADGAKHGAEIRRWVRARTESPELYPAMLYGSLEDLLERGWIEETGGADDAADRGRRRCYRITAAGRSALAEEYRRLTQLSRLARNVLEGST